MRERRGGYRRPRPRHQRHRPRRGGFGRGTPAHGTLRDRRWHRDLRAALVPRAVRRPAPVPRRHGRRQRPRRGLRRSARAGPTAPPGLRPRRRPDDPATWAAAGRGLSRQRAGQVPAHSPDRAERADAGAPAGGRSVAGGVAAQVQLSDPRASGAPDALPDDRRGARTGAAPAGVRGAAADGAGAGAAAAEAPRAANRAEAVRHARNRPADSSAFPVHADGFAGASGARDRRRPAKRPADDASAAG